MEGVGTIIFLHIILSHAQPPTDGGLPLNPRNTCTSPASYRVAGNEML